MTARVIDGRALAAELRAEVALSARRLREAEGVTPRLDVVLVGDDPASAAYVRMKTRAAAEAGLASRLWRLPATVSQHELLDLVAGRNADREVHGILVQLPLPAQIDATTLLEAIDPAKDVDGFHPLNVGRLASGLAGGFVPCTPQGCMRLLERALGREGLRGKRALVLGRSNIVGKPIALLLLAADCTVTVAHSRTADLPALCREAEILVAAAGRPAMVRGDWIRAGAVVIDVGINRVTGSDGRPELTGDVAFAEVADRAAAITPVPGGVGPMTVACVLANTVEAAGMAPRG